MLLSQMSGVVFFVSFLLVPNFFWILPSFSSSSSSSIFVDGVVVVVSWI